MILIGVRFTLFGRPVHVSALAAVTIGACALLAPGSAQAIPTGADSAAGKDVRVTAGLSGLDATALAARLGPARTAGACFDPTGDHVVVAVTDAAAAKAVTDAGGVAKLITYSTAQLKAITAELDRVPAIPNTGFGVDEVNNQVVVEVGGTVGGADLTRLRTVVQPHGAAARIERISGTMELGMAGGEQIKARTGRKCTAGFNVRDKSNPRSLFLVTAGHCTLGTATGLTGAAPTSATGPVRASRRTTTA